MSPPLILSFSQWEKGRLNKAQSVQHRSLSQRERDRVRGGDIGHAIHLLAIAGVSYAPATDAG